MAMLTPTNNNLKINTLYFKPAITVELSTDEAIVISRIDYWIQKCGKHLEGREWIYNTYEDWKLQFPQWSLSKIRRIFSSLEAKGYIFSKKMNASFKIHTKWYSVNYKKYNQLIARGAKEEKIREQTHLEKRSNLKSIKEKFIKAKDYTKLSNTNDSGLICSKWTNRSVQNEHIFNTETTNTKNNYVCLKEKSPEEKILDKIDFENEKVKTNKNFSDKENLENKSVVKNMLDTWKDIFPSSKEISITKKREKQLLMLWKEYFEENIEKWRSYCVDISSSKFLMGEKDSKFKAYFDWLIKEEIVERIGAGEFDIGDRETTFKKEQKMREKENKKEVIKEAINMESDDVKRILLESCEAVLSDDECYRGIRGDKYNILSLEWDEDMITKVNIKNSSYYFGKEHIIKAIFIELMQDWFKCSPEVAFEGSFSR